MKQYYAIDLFSGCGGLSEGLKLAGFKVVAAFDNDHDSIATYRLNHPSTTVFEQDIRLVQSADVTKLLGGNPLHLLTGCPPCQGFSSVRRLNKKRSRRDVRNSLVLEFLRFVRDLRPLTIMMENVPGLVNYTQFRKVTRELESLGYAPKVRTVDLQHYGVPQRRRRLVLVGSLLGDLDVVPPSYAKSTVRDAIGGLESVLVTTDHVHRIIANHRPDVLRRIKATPKNGGSRRDVPLFRLACHRKKGVGFNDVYGRLAWDGVSNTITGGCLNPSKGRFLHPDEDRAISAREAALLQTFRKSYKFPPGITKNSISLLIGNALPPKFSRIQSRGILQHITESGL